MLIRVTKQIHGFAESAHRAVERVEGIATNVNAITSVSAISRAVRAFIKDFKK